MLLQHPGKLKEATLHTRQSGFRARYKPQPGPFPPLVPGKREDWFIEAESNKSGLRPLPLVKTKDALRYSFNQHIPRVGRFSIRHLEDAAEPGKIHSIVGPKRGSSERISEHRLCCTRPNP